MNKKKLTKEDKVLISTDIIQFMEIPMSTVPDLRPILDIVLKLIDEGTRLKHFEKIREINPGKKLSHEEYLNYFRFVNTKEYSLETYNFKIELYDTNTKFLFGGDSSE